MLLKLCSPYSYLCDGYASYEGSDQVLGRLVNRDEP